MVGKTENEEIKKIVSPSSQDLVRNQSGRAKRLLCHYEIKIIK